MANVLKSYQVISHVNVELKTNVLEISSASIFWVDICFYVCKRKCVHLKYISYLNAEHHGGWRFSCSLFNMYLKELTRHFASHRLRYIRNLFAVSATSFQKLLFNASRSDKGTAWQAIRLDQWQWQWQSGTVFTELSLLESWLPDRNGAGVIHILHTKFIK
jgi:hypothetical protein